MRIICRNTGPKVITFKADTRGLRFTSIELNAVDILSILSMGSGDLNDKLHELLHSMERSKQNWDVDSEPSPKNTVEQYAKRVDREMQHAASLEQRKVQERLMRDMYYCTPSESLTTGSAVGFETDANSSALAIREKERQYRDFKEWTDTIWYKNDGKDLKAGVDPFVEAPYQKPDSTGLVWSDEE